MERRCSWSHLVCLTIEWWHSPAHGFHYKRPKQKFLQLSDIYKTKIIASGPITSWQIDGETMERVRDFILGGSKITADGDFSSVTQSCPTLCDPMNCSTPGLPVQHQLLEFTQTHVHWVGDAIQPSYPLSSPSPPALNLSQHQGLFQWVSSSHQVAKVLGVSASASVLPMNIQDWFPLG